MEVSLKLPPHALTAGIVRVSHVPIPDIAGPNYGHERTSLDQYLRQVRFPSGTAIPCDREPRPVSSTAEDFGGGRLLERVRREDKEALDIRILRRQLDLTLQGFDLALPRVQRARP